jgi:hypothetical protein
MPVVVAVAVAVAVVVALLGYFAFKVLMTIKILSFLL